MIPPFQDLVDHYWRDVARLCHALTGPDDAEDAIQATWLKALASYPSLANTSNLRAWLLTIASNVAMDGHRARKRRPSPVAEIEDESATVRDDAPDPVLWQQVRALPEQQRAAVALRYVLDLPHADIARLLDITPAMSRRLTSDGLANLRATYKGGER